MIKHIHIHSVSECMSVCFDKIYLKLARLLQHIVDSNEIL